MSSISGGTIYSAEISEAALNGFAYVASSSQSKRQDFKPSRVEPERDASRTGTPCCTSRAAKREVVLPVPPVRRIVIFTIVGVDRRTVKEIKIERVNESMVETSSPNIFIYH